jgi:ribonuclease P protein component
VLKKTNRLAKTRDVQRTTMRGRSFFNPYFVIKHFQGRTLSPVPRFTVTVGVRVSKKAVARNRIKRVIREGIRLHMGEFKPGDYVIIVKSSAMKLPSNELSAQVIKSMKNNRLLV